MRTRVPYCFAAAAAAASIADAEQWPARTTSKRDG
jgi:hypothetical protein